ncbi:hypothetical protein, partial [Escherichia coli]
CGRCVDVCSEDVFTITTRWSSGAKSLIRLEINDRE